MNLVKVKCAFCGKEFFREKGRYNEAKKFDWAQYCSRRCLSKDRIKKQVLFCENCGKSFMRKPSEISPHNYCSKSCAAIVNNKRYPKKHPKPEFRVCVRCGKKFRKSTGNKKYCSMRCRREAERYTPKELLGIVKDTAQRLGKIPARRELREIDSACRKLFGSWNNAIIAAGFKPNRSHSQRMYKCANTKALDGHLCDSISELIIDNWFMENNISHERDVSYPTTNHKADWAINVKGQAVFVEYFGLANDSPRYDRTIRKKKMLCRKHKLTLIEIYPQDIYPKEYLNDKLKDKFKNLINF